MNKLNFVDNETININTGYEFPGFSSISHGDLLGLSLSANTANFTHGLHRFPAKYIPQVPRWAMREFASYDSIVLDPFMGSGTTLVEGICRVKETYGIDIDPLARLISKSKTADYSIERLLHFSEEILTCFNQNETNLFLPMDGVKDVDHWFSIPAWSALCALYNKIHIINCSLEERDFFLCVFSSILRWVSNADDQTQKTYVSGTKIKIPPPVWETYRKAVTRAIKGVEELKMNRIGGDAKILNGSALEIPMDDKYVDLIITSPPYLDSVDYMYNFMLEYFWLGPSLGITNRNEYNQRRRIPIGAKNPTEESILPVELNEIFNIDDIPRYRRSAVISYFKSMSTHFFEAARVLKDGGRYILVVGNSQAEKGVIPVHDSLVQLARNAGLYIEKAFGYRIRRHYMKFPRKGRGGIILMDWIITLRKSEDLKNNMNCRLPIPDIRIGDSEVAN